MKNALKFVTLLFSTITLAVLFAHLFALPGKINLSKDDYQVVQQIYRGWALLGIFEIGAIVFTLIWTIADRKHKAIFPFLLIAQLCFVASIIIFFIFTFPANQATVNWTELPENWQILRKNWEYSHATRALLCFTGYVFLIVTILRQNKNVKSMG